MAAAGLIERRPDPSDRRGTRVRLTPMGRRLIDRAMEAHLANQARILAPLSPAQRRQLEGLLRTLLLGMEADA